MLIDSSVLMSREDLLEALSILSAMGGDVDRLAGGVAERLLDGFTLEVVLRVASLAVKLPAYSSSVSQAAISIRRATVLCYPQHLF